MVAVGAIQAAREAGLHVPDDISITGFDNIPLAAAFDPPLTVMSQPTEQEGHLAAELLLARIERPGEIREPRELTLECNLIVRASTAPPAGRRRKARSARTTRKA
jgi:DNA-binding LacI/PurR family transcriptional regulator